VAEWIENTTMLVERVSELMLLVKGERRTPKLLLASSKVACRNRGHHAFAIIAA
jgi:hypothetical protein